MDTKRLIVTLNELLAKELAAEIRYRTHAALVTGLYAEPIITRLNEIADDEAAHADTLRDRIVALGGQPTMRPAAGDLIAAHEVKRILQVNLKDEAAAVAQYQRFLQTLPHEEGTILYEELEGIVEDEQEHTEELQRLLGR